MRARGQNSRFRVGSGVFTCEICGRRTRHTGVQAISSRTCPECFELAGLENTILDGVATVEDVIPERDRLVALIVSRGGAEA